MNTHDLPSSTCEAAIRLGLEDPRTHALTLGYWHTIVTPLMVFAHPYTAERPVAALGAKYGWARADGLDPAAAGTARSAAGQFGGKRPEHLPADEEKNNGVRTNPLLKEVRR